MNKNILALFAKNEQKISRLYKLYSRKNPDFKIFWSDLADEEIIHAEILQKAQESLSKTSASELFEKNKYAYDIIRYISGFIDQESRKARAGDITPIEAVNNALRLEQSMIEEKCFEIFSPKEKALKRVIEKLREETKDHIQRLQKIGRQIRDEK